MAISNKLSMEFLFIYTNYVNYFEHLLTDYKNAAIFMPNTWKIKDKRKRTLRNAGLYGNSIIGS